MHMHKVSTGRQIVWTSTVTQVLDNEPINDVSDILSLCAGCRVAAVSSRSSVTSTTRLRKSLIMTK